MPKYLSHPCHPSIKCNCGGPLRYKADRPDYGQESFYCLRCGSIYNIDKKKSNEEMRREAKQIAEWLDTTIPMKPLREILSSSLDSKYYF